MVSRIIRSRDEKDFSNTQHQGAPDPVPLVPGREIKNAVLLQVAKQIEIETKKANKKATLNEG